MMLLQDLIRSYEESDSGKQPFIEQYLFTLKEEDFNAFLEYLILNAEFENRRFLVDLLSQHPDRALSAALHLVGAVNPEDTLATLKYYGAQIIEKTGSKLDYTITIPLLIAAYNQEDYRDARWAISMALSKIIKGPIELITSLLLLKNENDRDELSTNILSYSGIDIPTEEEG